MEVSGVLILFVYAGTMNKCTVYDLSYFVVIMLYSFISFGHRSFIIARQHSSYSYLIKILFLSYNLKCVPSIV